MASQQRHDVFPTETFKKRSGTANVGQLYEIKLLSLVLFRLLQELKLDSFYLGSNIADIGAFDDIVFKITVGGKTRMQLVQLNHKSPEFTVYFEDLFKKEDKKDDFSLLKYFHTYLKIRNKFSTASSDVMFQGEFENMGVDLIIFTNARFTFPEKVCTIKNTDSSDILYTKCSGKTVKIECSEAVLKYLQTESVMWHKKVIGAILTKIILLQDYNTSDLADTISKIKQENVAGENNDFNCSNLLRLYSNQQLPAVNSEAFSKLYDKIVNMIDETLLPTIDEHSSLVKDFLAKLSFYSEQATDDVLDALTRRVMKSMIYPDESLFLNKFYDFVGNFFRKSDQNQYLTEQCNFLEKIANEIKLEEMHSKSLSKINCDFLNFRKMYLKNKKISNIFQRLTQNEPYIINIVSSTPELSCIKFVQLLQFQENKFAFLTIDNENSERMQEVLEKVKPLFIIVIYLPEFNLKLVENIYRNATKLLIITKNEPKGNFTSVTETMINLLDLENHSQEMVLETPVVFQGASVSLNVLLGNAPRELIDGEVLQKIYSGETLVVGKPCSLNEPIKYYIDRTLCDNHNQQVSKSITEIFDRVAVIAAEPGMGKTTFFAKYVAEIKKYNPSCWIVSLNLLEYSRQFNEWKNEKRVLNEDDAFKFLSMVCQMNPTESFERRILDWYCQQCKVYLIVDGFDEISFDHSRVVLGLLRIYNYKFAAKLWITTRAGGIQQDLEEHLEVSAFTLKPFTNEQTKLYFGNFWADKGKINSTDTDVNLKDFIEIIFSRLCSPCNNDERDLISTPLHLNMIATIFHDQFNDRSISKSNNIQGEKLNLISLYEKFIDLKFNSFIISASSKRHTDNFQELKNKHKKMAIFALFDHANQSNLLDAKDIDDVEKCIQKMSNLSEKTGLIEKIVDGKPIFVHHTFAEYFAALFIWNKYASLSIEDSTKFIDVVFINSIITPDRYQIAKFLSGMAMKRDKNTPNITNKTSVLLDRLVDNLPCSCRDFGRKSFGYMLGIVEWCLNPENECCFELSKVLMDKPHDCVNLLLLKASESGHKRLVRLIIEYFLETSSDINRATIKNGQTALHLAVQNGYADIVELLVQKGANINSTTFDDGRTPLYQASINGALDAVKVLLEFGAYTNLGKTNNAYTPLHCAAQNNFPEIINLLIHKGANIDCTTSDEGRTPLYQAACCKSTNAVKMLLDLGANANLGKISDGFTPLHWAAQNDSPKIIQLLVNKGANVDCITTDDGRTPLNIAAHCKSINAVKLLLDLGANANLGKISDGFTPLHWAAQNDWPEIIQLLVNKGANVDCITTDDGRTPLNIAAHCKSINAVKLLLDLGANVHLSTLDNATSALHLAASNDNPEIIRLLVDRGANVHCTTTDDGRTPLHEACANGALNAVQIILNMGANVNIRTTDKGLTPLHLAAQKNYTDIIEILIDYGADIDNPSWENGRTPLYLASKNGAKEAIKILLDLGANVNLGDKDNAYSPLHYAAQKDLPEIIQLLVERGANIDSTTRDNGHTPLFEACRNKALKAVKMLLNLGANARVGSRDTNFSPLHLAAQQDCPEVIKLLVDCGANIDSTTMYDGATPLVEACRVNAVSAVKMLLELGANVHLGTFDKGATPLHFAACNDNPEIVKLLVHRSANIDCLTTDDGRTPLYEACQNNALSAVKMLLKMGANPNLSTTECEYSPLHMAAINNCTETIKLLTESGANIDSVTWDYGRTALYEAFKNDAMDAVKILLQLGAKVNLHEEGKANYQDEKHTSYFHKALDASGIPTLVNNLLGKGEKRKNDYEHEGKNERQLKTDQSSFSTLMRNMQMMCAIKNNNLLEVERLLKSGADINFVNIHENHETPLHAAVFTGNDEIVTLLLANGANVEAKNSDNLKPVDLMSTILEYEKKQAIHAAFEKHFKQNESTKGPSECNATYCKRSGTAAIRGQCYETKLLAMVLLRLLHDDRIESFQLGSNMDEAGAFDDVVLRTTVGGKSRVCCLQAKHARRSVHFDDLDKTGKTFQDQQKGYLESYLNLRYMFSANSDNIIFQNHFEKTELEVIVFTPATLNHLREDFIETSSSGTIFHTHEGGKKVEIKSSQTLLELFINASKQWHKAMVAEILAKLILIEKYDTFNVKESIKRLQKDNILRKFNSDKINDFDYSSLLRLYSNRNIMTVSGENIRKLCSEITKILDEPLIPTYEIHTEIVNNFFNSLKFYSDQATEDELDEIIRHDIKSRNYESEDTIFLKFHEAVEKWWRQTGNVPFLTKNCKIFETAVDETKLANLHSSSLNRVRTDLFKFRRNEIVKPKWVKIHEDIQSQEHFFMNISSSIPELSCVKFMQFFQWFEADFNFIIIDNSDEDTITELLSKVKPSCVKIVYLPRFEPAAIEKVRLAVKKSIVITTQPYQGDWTCIQDETKNLLAFETSSQERLLESVVTFQGEQIPLKTLIDQAPRSLIDGVILRKLVEGEQFAVSNSNFFMDHEEFYIPRTLTNNRQISKSDSEIRDRVAIVAAEPGMGKSTFLTNLAFEMKKSNPANWIVRINLLDYSKQFYEWSKNYSVLDKDYALSFLQNVTIGGENREIGNFEREIFQWYCEQYKIHLLIDGFDEISPDYTSAVLNLLKLYKENFTASLWVTTRTGGVRRKLEETFNIYSYRLDPFSCVDAELFLKKYWKNALAFDNRVKIKELDGFMGVPLVLNMLSKIYQNYSEENPNLPAFEQMDLITLYDHFIALKLEATIFNNIQEFQHKHKLAAIYTLFNQTEVKAFFTRSEIYTMDAFSQDFNNSKTKTGLIKKIIDNRPIFVHQTYAEFLAAQFIWEKYSSLQNDDFDKLVESILIGNLVRYDRIQITNFLKEILKKSSQICANIVTKTCKLLSTLIDQSPTKFHKYNKQVFYDMLGMVEHFLTLDSSLHSTLQTLVKNKPVTKRNMLLLRAFECGYIELIRTISDDELIIETLQEISSNSKSDLGFTPLHWAAKKNLPEIASLLLREGAPIDSVTKLDGSTALHLAVSHGNTQIVQVLLDRGADLNHRTVHGKTALHLAVEKNFCEIAAMLVKKGAPLCGSSTDDIPTPLQLAMENRHEQMVQLLKDLQPRGYYQKKFSTFK